MAKARPWSQIPRSMRHSDSRVRTWHPGTPENHRERTDTQSLVKPGRQHGAFLSAQVPTSNGSGQRVSMSHQPPGERISLPNSLQLRTRG